MAVIVQPYNGWREQLAASILSPLISGMIQRSQQSADNRKYNAMFGEYANMMGQPQQQQVPSLLAGFEQPSSNGWENAFRQSTNVLADFDMNVPQVTPSTQPMNQAQAFQNLFTLLGNPRFSHLNTTEAINRLNPYLQAMEAQRMTDLRNQYATGLQSANSFDDQVNLIMRAAMEGAANDNTVNSLVDYAKYRQPYYRFSEMDTGDKKYLLAGNPATGQITPMFNADVGVSPNTRATLDTNRYIADQTADIERQKINNAQINADRNYSLADRAQTEAETQGQYNRENPTLVQVYGEDGTVYFANPKTAAIVQATTPDGRTIKDPTALRAMQDNLYITQDEAGNYIGVNRRTGTAKPVTTPDGKQVKGLPKTTATPKPTQDMTDSQKKEYSTLEAELKEARKQRDKYADKVETFSDEPDGSDYKSAKANFDYYASRIEEIKAEMREVLQKNNNQSQPQQGAVPSVTPGTKSQPAVPSTASPDVAPQVTPSPSAVSRDMEPEAPSVTPKAPESSDIKPKTQDVKLNNGKTAEVMTDPNKPKNTKHSDDPKDYLFVDDIPEEFYYNPERDKDIPKDNVVTLQQLIRIINGVQRKFTNTEHLTPLTILYRLYKQFGLRIVKN